MNSEISKSSINKKEIQEILALAGLKPGSSDPETNSLPLSYWADDEELCFVWIQITNILIYLVKNARLRDLNDAYSGTNKTSILHIPTRAAATIKKKKFYKNNMAAIFLFFAWKHGRKII